MKIETKYITIRELIDGYEDDDEGGVYAYGGLLTIRPEYQREFIYNDKQRNEVINTIRKGFPLNSIYWTQEPDGTYQLLDGQQRTISICQYIAGDYSINFKYFFNLDDADMDEILDYQIPVYVCVDGTEQERLDWFRIVNVAGEKLTDQELLNAIYCGPYINDARRYMSKVNGPAFNIASDYLSGTTNRQDYLHTALVWIADRERTTIENYLDTHRRNLDAKELWEYFTEVIDWVKSTFPHYRKTMKGLPWGIWYNKYKDELFDPKELEERILALEDDEDVTNYKGIYEYLLDGDEAHLGIREFTEKDIKKKFNEINGVCPVCGQKYNYDDMVAEKITPWSNGGKAVYDNIRLVCRDCIEVHDIL